MSKIAFFTFGKQKRKKHSVNLIKQHFLTENSAALNNFSVGKRQAVSKFESTALRCFFPSLLRTRQILKEIKLKTPISLKVHRCFTVQF